MRVAVVGAGIAGSAAAIALQAAGIEVEVFEAHPAPADEVGAWLTLANNGLDALAVIGLGAEIGRLGFPTPLFEMFEHRGRRVGAFPFGEPRADGLEVRSIERAALYRTLSAAAARRGVPVRFGKQLIDAHLERHRVRATFADGDRIEADLLVGADGLRSRVRSIIDPAAPKARYGGLLNTGGFARDVRLPTEFHAPPGVMHFRFGRRCFMGYATAPNGDVWWFANSPSKQELGREELREMDPTSWRQHLVELFDGDRTPAAQLIDGTDHVFAGWNTYDVPTLPHWRNERMVLIGDAAHAVSPAAGQGAALALEDGVVLAQHLRDDADLATALARFEAVRRPRVERAVEQGRRSGSGKAAGPIERVLRDRVFLPLAQRRYDLRGAHESDWLWGHHIDWQQSTRTPSAAQQSTDTVRPLGEGDR